MRRRTWALALLVTALLQSAVLAQKAPRERAYCYFNAKTMTWRLGNDAVERTIHFDRDAGSLRTLRVVTKLPGVEFASVANSDGEFTVTPEGGSPIVLRLDGDWDFMFPIVHNDDGGGRTLTIHLQGKRRNAGYEVEAVYSIGPGKQARLVDRLLLVNRTGRPVALGRVTIGRWVLVQPVLAGRPAAAETAHLVPGGGKGMATLKLGSAGPTLLAAVERGDEGGGPTVMDGEVTLERNALVISIDAHTTLEPAQRWQSTRATVWAQPAEPAKRTTRP